MTVLLTILGVILIFVALLDIFLLLFHPTGHGMNQVIAHTIWRTFRRIGGRWREALVLAGPVAFLCVLASWIILLVVGWALIYWPLLPDAFNFDPGLEAATHTQFTDALYLSLVTIGTLGYGDITPLIGLLRILAPIQAIVGFGVLTASISWLVSIFPALTRRRALADAIAYLRAAESETETSVEDLGPHVAQQMLGELTTQLASVRSDLILFPITYYFSSQDEQAELASRMPYLLRLAQRSSDENHPGEVRVRAAALREAIDGFAYTVASRFLGLSSATTEEAYARAHLHASQGDDKEQA